MAIARKSPGKPAKPAMIEGTAQTLSIGAPGLDDAILPAFQETLEATISKAEEMQEQVRRTAEQSIEQTRAMYEKMKTAAEEATASVETSFSAIAKGVNEINLKTLEAMKGASDAQYEFVKALLATKSLSEAIALQGDHARTQFEAMNEQAKEIAALIQKVSSDSVEPIKASFTKGMQIAA